MIRAAITQFKKCFGCEKLIPDSFAGTHILCVFRWRPAGGGGYHTQHEVCPECYRRERG